MNHMISFVGFAVGGFILFAGVVMLGVGFQKKDSVTLCGFSFCPDEEENALGKRLVIAGAIVAPIGLITVIICMVWRCKYSQPTFGRTPIYTGGTTVYSGPATTGYPPTTASGYPSATGGYPHTTGGYPHTTGGYPATIGAGAYTGPMAAGGGHPNSSGAPPYLPPAGGVYQGGYPDNTAPGEVLLECPFIFYFL